MRKKNLKKAGLTKSTLEQKPWQFAPEFNEKLISKRNILSYTASIYDPLDLISASYIIGKFIYRELTSLRYRNPPNFKEKS